MYVCVDDRAVRDTERKAAIMHFDTEQVSPQTYLSVIVLYMYVRMYECMFVCMYMYV